MIRRRILLLLLLFGLLHLDYTSARRFSSGIRFGGGSRSSSRISKPSYSPGRHSTSSGHKPVSHPSAPVVHTPHTSSTGGHLSHPINHGGSGTAHQPSHKDVNTPFLHSEGGGATKPKISTNNQPPSLGFNTNNKPATSPYAPSAPVLHENKPAVSPYAPSAPVLHENKPLLSSTPNQGFKPNAPTSNNHPIGFNPNFNPNTHTSNNHPIGFHPNPQPNSNPVLPPSYPRNPSYPQTSVPLSNHPYPAPSYPVQNAPHFNPGTSFVPPSSHPFGHPTSYPSHPSAPHYPNIPNGHPIGNPYGGGYPSPGHNVPPGPAFYPQQQQQQHYFAQPAAQPYVPGQTILMLPNQQSSGRGIGDMVKEALVFSTINAGVNRLINPHTHYHESRTIVSEGSTSGTGTGTGPGAGTHITYNNYYNNSPGNATGGSTVPQNPAMSPNPMSPNPINNPTGSYNPPNPNTPFNNGVYYPPQTGSTVLDPNGMRAPSQLAPVGNQTNSTTNNTNSNAQQANMGPVIQYAISDQELQSLTEDLFAKEEHNVSKYIEMLNLQTRYTSGNITDLAEKPLLEVRPEVYNIPSIKLMRALYNNYERNASVKEIRTSEKREEENIFLDTILNTNVMHTAMKWLASRNFIDPDDFERKDILRHIWFTQFGGTSTGFERVFASEVYGGTDILGVQDWIYFNYEEAEHKIDYLGYVDTLKLGDKASLVKLNFKMDGIIRPNVTIFVGTTPELEMSLYTICFYARPNNLCPVSLGNTTFHIYTHAFRHYGKDLIDLAIPIF